MGTTEYDRYVREGWALFTRDPARRAAAREAVADLSIRRVLDIGCGAGQELRPFASEGVLAIGVDPSPEVGLAGRELFGAAMARQKLAEPIIEAQAELKPWMEPPLIGFAKASYDDLREQLAALLQPGNGWMTGQRVEVSGGMFL